MSTKYYVSKRYNPIAGKKQWATICLECGQKEYAFDWDYAIFLTSYLCSTCELRELDEIELYETAKAALDDLGVYRA